MGAVAVHHTDTTNEAWDGAGQVANLGDEYTTGDLKDVFAWLPDDDEPKKSEAKFPHHEVSSSGEPGAANVTGCRSGIGVLNGAMGGADIPDSDRQAVYDHLAAHLKDAGITPPELNQHRPPSRVPARTHPRPIGPDDTRRDPPMPTATDLSDRATVRGVERRSTPFQSVDLRAKPDGTGGTALHFTGYACVTEAGYELQDWLGSFTEVVRTGAFAKTLAESADVPFKINHEGLTLARTKSGTMRLEEDTTGLLVDADLDPASPHVQGLRSAMERGDVDEMSFAFWVTRQQWSPDYDQRDILEVNLNKGDVSVVNYGANPATAGASLRGRALIEHVQTLTVRERRELLDRLFAETYPQAEAPDALLLADRAALIQWVQARSEELRAGKALSGSTMTVLAQVLDLIASADNAVDEAQPLLADLMGVANPNADDTDDSDDDADSDDGDGPDAGSDDNGGTDDGGQGQQDSAPAAPQALAAPAVIPMPLDVHRRRLAALQLTR